MSTANIEVTVVIPNYNNVKLLNNLLSSLKKSKTPFNTIIIDNNSEDESVSLIKEKYPEVLLVENDKNEGFAKAVNQGIALTETEYVFLLNNDTEVCEDTIEYLLTLIKRDSNIFAVSSKMMQYNNKNLIDDAGDEYNLLGWSKKRGYNHQATEYDDDSEIFSACAGAALYRTDIFNQIGFFDETFESYVEDMDLSFRARMHGYKIMYSSRAIVYHHGSATTGSRYNSFKVKISARNNIYLIHKNMPFWMKILNFIFIFIGCTIKYIFFYKKGLSNYYSEGIKEGLQNRNSLKKTKTSSIKNMIKIEYEMLKNTFKYPF